MKAALLAIPLMLVGCREKPEAVPPPKPTPKAPPAVQPSDLRLRVHVDVEPAHLNPILLPDRCDEWCFRIALGPIYEPLFHVDEQGFPVPGGLAASVQVNEERTVLDVDLRPGAKWHDGRPVTPSDVAFTYHAILDTKNDLETLRRDLFDLHMVELSAARPRRVRIRLVRANSFVTTVMAEVPILPGHLFRTETGKVDWLRHSATRRPIGSGPYQFEEWKRGKRIVLRRFEEHTPPGGPREIVFVLDPDGADALARLRRDEIDVLSRVLPIHYPDEALTPLTKKRFVEIRLKPARFALLLLNVQREPLSDLRVRKALAQLVDRESLLKGVRRGLGRLIGVPGLGDAFEPPPVDAGAAARLLDEAGLARAEEGGPRLLQKRPWKLDLLTVSRAPIAEQQARRIAADFEKQGITSGPRFVERRDLFDRLRKGDFDAAVVTFTGRSDIDLSPLLSTGGAFNYGGFSDAGVDAALEALRRQPPGEGRKRARHDLGRRLTELHPAIFLYAVEEAALVRRTLRGLSSGGGWLDLSRVTMAATPAQKTAKKETAEGVR